MEKVEICEHCGQELKIAAKDRKTISDALTLRQDKLDAASADMLAIIQRIEAKVGADAESLEDVANLRAKIKARAEAEAKEKNS